MKKNDLILLIFALITVFMLSAGSASAQDIDVDSMDNEQLTALLMQILNKLEQEEAPETSAGAPAVPAAEPETVEEVIQITIYENKKLTVEALPGYMFIRPTKPARPEPEPEPEVTQPTGEKQPEPDNTPEHYENEPGIDDIDGGPCTWSFWDGQWRCMKG